jgi:hypothetical protein
MNYCPLMSYNGSTISRRCFREDCALAANENGECLIKQALNFYVKEREEASKSGWKKAKLMYKDNSSCQDNKIEIVSEESE